MFFVFFALICMMLRSYRTHIILYTVFNVDCGAQCLMYIVYISSLLFSSSAPFSVKAQLPYKGCFNVKQAAFKLPTISLSSHSAFLTPPSFFFSLPPFVSIFFFHFRLSSSSHLVFTCRLFPPSFSSVAVFLPLLAPSQSGAVRHSSELYLTDPGRIRYEGASLHREC